MKDKAKKTVVGITGATGMLEYLNIVLYGKKGKNRLGREIEKVLIL